MTKISVEIEIDTDRLNIVSDSRLALLWHVAQANPAPIGDYFAGDAAVKIGAEIIRRWLHSVPPEMWTHQGRSHYWKQLCQFARYEPGGEGDDFHRGRWVPDAEKIAAWEATQGAIQEDIPATGQAAARMIRAAYIGEGEDGQRG